MRSEAESKLTLPLQLEPPGLSGELERRLRQEKQRR